MGLIGCKPRAGALQSHEAAGRTVAAISRYVSRRLNRTGPFQIPAMHDRAVTFFRELQDRICAGPGEGRRRRDLPRGRVDAARRRRRADARDRGRRRLREGRRELLRGVRRVQPRVRQADSPATGTTFTATGVSLVLHPRSPLVPTVHANFRYLTHGSKAWFGGGADLTPYYPFKEDVIHFHNALEAGVRPARRRSPTTRR